jgi:hypothetical protein
MDPPRMTGMPKWGPYVFLAAISFVFLQEYIYSIGRADASGIQEFLVYTDTPSCLVVREYSDHLICAEYDSVQVLPVFRLIPLEGYARKGRPLEVKGRPREQDGPGHHLRRRACTWHHTGVAPADCRSISRQHGSADTELYWTHARRRCTRAARMTGRR